MEKDQILTIVAAVLTIGLTISEWLGMSKCTSANSIVQLIHQMIKKEEKSETEEESSKRRKVVTFQE